MKKYTPLFVFILLSNVAFSQLTSLHEDFTNCVSNFPNQWHAYDVNGTESWQCSNTGHAGKGVQISGYSSGSNHDNEDWLFSPIIDLSAYNNPMLSFWSRTKFNGSIIQIKVSSNYNGISDPNMASWTNLMPSLPTVGSDTWFLSSNISLQAFKNQPIYIAFRYVSNTTSAATWKIDDVDITDGTLTIDKKFMNIGQSNAGNPSETSQFHFTMSGAITNFDVEIPSPFEISKDGINFSNQLNYSSSIDGLLQTVYVKIHPLVADKVYRNSIIFKLNGNLLAEKVMLLGTSLPNNKTLRMYTWNMRWFGDPNSCNCDTNIARLNATQILKDINADIYCLQEVVNNNQIAIITSALGSNYQSIVSPFGSFASTASDPDYAGAQKLAFIYNKDKIVNLGTFGLLASTTLTDTSSNSGYYCFASGRYPFVMKAQLKLENGLFDTLIITTIHAKAISDITSYNRRACGAEKMTDSLNTLFPGSKIIVLGDYNDYLEGSSVSGMSVSPYKYMLDHGFEGITLPSLYPNETTYIGSTNNILDNVVVSQNLLSSYPDSSCFMFHEVESYINDYGNSTSDHIPVMSYFKFDFPMVTNVDHVEPTTSHFNIVNPSSGDLIIHFTEALQEEIRLTIYDITGHVVYTKQIKNPNGTIEIDLTQVLPGLYFVELNQANKREVKKWLNLH